MKTFRCNLLRIAMTGFSSMVCMTVLAQTGGKTSIVYNQSGMGLTIVLVFAGLFILLAAFKYIAKRMTGDSGKNAVQAVQAEAPVTPAPDKAGEINAAIAMALYLYSNELHDQENPVITMIRVSRTYSPWSSKIYGIRKSPR